MDIRFGNMNTYPLIRIPQKGSLITDFTIRILQYGFTINISQFEDLSTEPQYGIHIPKSSSQIHNTESTFRRFSYFEEEPHHEFHNTDSQNELSFRRFPQTTWN